MAKAFLPQVLEPKRLSSQLEEATRAYLMQTVSVDLESHKVKQCDIHGEKHDNCCYFYLAEWIR